MPATSPTRLGQTFEPLEARHLPAGVTAWLTGGVLYVQGTNAADRIQVGEANETLTVSSNGTAVSVSVGGVRYPGVSVAVVGKVSVRGMAGNDLIELGNVAGGQGVSRPAELWGEAGNDRLIGGRADNRFDGGTGFDTYGQPTDFAAPVVNGCRVDDIEQRELGTCQTLASLAAAVNNGWDFGQRIAYRGQTAAGAGEYDVTLAGGTQRVLFDGTWTDQDPAPTNAQHEGWVILMQRARLQSLFGPLDFTRPLPSDATLDRTSGYRYGNMADALFTLTGQTVQTLPTAAVTVDTLAGLAGRMTVAASVRGTGTTPTKIVRSHVYAIVAVSSANGGTVRLYNPYHKDGPTGAVTGADDGYVDLTLAQFRQSFAGIAFA